MEETSWLSCGLYDANGDYVYSVGGWRSAYDMACVVVGIPMANVLSYTGSSGYMT